jgi:hypothetical protein
MDYEEALKEFDKPHGPSPSALRKFQVALLRRLCADHKIAVGASNTTPTKAQCITAIVNAVSRCVTSLAEILTLLQTETWRWVAED